jgi:D-alanyl-D-alanine dipeptidase
MSYSPQLQLYRERPIPDQGAVRRERSGSRAWVINHGATEMGESLVLVNLRGKPWYSIDHNPPYHEKIPGAVGELYARHGVVHKLHTIQALLASSHLEIYLYDAWRTQATQSYCRDVWFTRYVQQEHPDWSPEQVAHEVGMYWAKGPSSEEGIDRDSPPPHATGAAIDLTLAYVGGDPLWMGSLFDDVSPAAHADYLEYTIPTERSFTYQEALRNRRMLYWLFRDAGFEINPNEWWHVSWGDQFWAKIQSWREGKEIAAVYSATTPPHFASRTTQ